MKHFNKLTPGELERISILAEECAEVIQVIGKVLRHGYESKHPDGGPTNRELLEEEIGHVFAAVDFLEEDDLDYDKIQDYRNRKHKTIAPYLHHQGIEL